MDDRTRSLTLAVNKAGQREPEEPLAGAVREARQALAKVTSGKYLGKIYGQCRSWQEAVRVGPILPASKDWLAPLNLPSQAQMVYVALKGLIVTIAPPAGAAPPCSKAESIKVGARRELLTAAERLLAADTRKLKILDRKRAEISGLRAETDRAWGIPASSRQRCLFEPG